MKSRERVLNSSFEIRNSISSSRPPTVPRPQESGSLLIGPAAATTSSREIAALVSEVLVETRVPNLWLLPAGANVVKTKAFPLPSTPC